MKQHECKNKPVKGTGILNVLEFCCEKGLQIIRNDIKEKHNIKQNNNKMEYEYRFKIAICWQIGLSIGYYQRSIIIEILCFQLAISMRRHVGGWFKWYNLLKG